MGAEQSRHGALTSAAMCLRMTARGLNAEETKARKNAVRSRAACLAAMRRDQIDELEVREYAEEVVTYKASELRYRRLARRVKGAANRVEEACAQNRVTESLARAVAAMGAADVAFPLDQVGAIMEAFDRCVENTNVATAYVNDEMKKTDASQVPPGAVNQVIQELGDKHSLQISDALLNASTPFGSLPAAATPLSTAATVDEPPDALLNSLPSVPGGVVRR